MALEANQEITAQRLDGITRAFSYPLPPMLRMTAAPNPCFRRVGHQPGLYPKCKAKPIVATLGVPESSDPELAGVDASPREVAEILKNSRNSCVKARIGTRFRSMTAAVDEKGNPLVEIGHRGGVDEAFLQEHGGSELELSLLDLINSSEMNFNEAS